MRLSLSLMLLAAGIAVLRNLVTVPVSLQDHLSSHYAGWICVILAIVWYLYVLITARDGSGYNRYRRRPLSRHT